MITTDKKKKKFHVYMVQNLLTGQGYIGCSKLLNKRYLGGGSLIKKAVKEYGRENFSLQILHSFFHKDIASEKERLCIEEYRTHKKYGGYNTKTSGGSYKEGEDISEYTKKKMSETKTGEKHPMYGRTGEKSPMWGKTQSEEVKKKLSMAQAGKKNPMYGRTGEKNPMYGRTGEKSPMYGRTGEKSPMYGRTGEKSPMYGRTGEKHPRHKLTEIEVLEIRKKLSEGISCAELGRIYGVCRANIGLIKHGKTWNHLL